VLLTIAVVLFSSALNVFYRDVKYALPFFIQLWMYLSPVIYSVSSVPDGFKSLYMLNPMAPIIGGYRKVLVLGASPDFYYLGISAFVALVTLFLSYKYFKIVELSFADRI
jgi:lipopolysaccharide transport system permease protein